MVLAMKSTSTRRDFLVAGAWATLAAGGLLIFRLVGSALWSGPRLSRRIVTVGPLSSLPLGGSISAPGIIVIHDERGVAAVSSRCTHLGCTVTSNARGFECACHGSAFARDGRVLRGPATAPLPWYRVILGEDGVLRVDLDAVVGSDLRLDPEART
jgi:cytochrome b6-f complex iron-sulfur subunit